MQPWFLRVTGSKYLNVTLSEIRQHWSLRDLVNHIHYINGVAAEEKHQQKKSKRKFNKKKPKMPKI